MENFENENREITDVEAVETESIEKNGKKPYDWKKELMDWVQAIVIALVVSFLLKTNVTTELE